MKARLTLHTSESSVPQTPTLNEAIRAETRRISAEQIKLRRHLHQYPEVSMEEYLTTETLTKALQKLGVRFCPVQTPTGLLVELTGHKPGRTVAVRTDIDALPISEQTGLPFASKNTGCMHACGHDMHMATVWGTVAVLSRLRDRFEGTVRFVFQPAEEMPPGGARPMIASGALNQVAAIFGLHNDPHLATGRISLRDGATMASVTDFDLVVRGKSAHAARPHTGVDAIVTAAEVVQSLQTVVSRESDPTKPVAITFGKISGGVARNVIAGGVRLTGTARSLSVATARNLAKSIGRVAKHVARARGAEVGMQLIADYPVLYNDARVNRVLARNMERLFGPGKIDTTPQMLGGEDFACYLEVVPGAMFRLGVMNKKIKADKPWHSPEFIADEEALPIGTALLAASVTDVLAGGLA